MPPKANLVHILCDVSSDINTHLKLKGSFHLIISKELSFCDNIYYTKEMKTYGLDNLSPKSTTDNIVTMKI